jgi:hypothetical protein
MKIGLIDVDGHNFPNLALMKISAYHKAIGYQPLFGHHSGKKMNTNWLCFMKEENK